MELHAREVADSGGDAGGCPQSQRLQCGHVANHGQEARREGGVRKGCQQIGHLRRTGSHLQDVAHRDVCRHYLGLSVDLRVGWDGDGLGCLSLLEPEEPHLHCALLCVNGLDHSLHGSESRHRRRWLRPHLGRLAERRRCRQDQESEQKQADG